MAILQKNLVFQWQLYYSISILKHSSCKLCETHSYWSPLLLSAWSSTQLNCVILSRVQQSQLYGINSLPMNNT